MIFVYWKTIDASLHGFITNQHNDQLPIGLLAQLVEHCTGIAFRGPGFKSRTFTTA